MIIKIQFILFTITLLFIEGCASNQDSSVYIFNDRWISTSSPRSEIWFQNWADYQRLLIVNDSDTIDIKPSPYVTDNIKKPYLIPEVYKTVEKQQIKGNLYWNELPVWENGATYSCKWEVDRANPKMQLPKTYNIEMAVLDNVLKINIKYQGESFLNKEYRPVTNY